MKRAFVGAMILAGCFAPDLGDGQVACGTAGECPPSYVCGNERRCWRTPLDGGAGDARGPASTAPDLGGGGGSGGGGGGGHGGHGGGD
jgi:hypothetical protein